MSLINYIINLKFKKIIIKLFQKYRVLKYKYLSDLKNISGKSINISPVLINGNGRIEFKNNVILGVINSQKFYSNYIYIEARESSSQIVFGNNVSINNNANIVCSKSSIIIMDNCLIGSNFTVFDTDFHQIDPNYRNDSCDCNPVYISENVFIGSNVTILKGVTIGKNSIIASGAVVTKSVPDNTIVGGIPAKEIKKI